MLASRRIIVRGLLALGLAAAVPAPVLAQAKQPTVVRYEGLQAIWPLWRKAKATMGPATSLQAAENVFAALIKEMFGAEMPVMFIGGPIGDNKLMLVGTEVENQNLVARFMLEKPALIDGEMTNTIEITLWAGAPA